MERGHGAPGRAGLAAGPREGWLGGWWSGQRAAPATGAWEERLEMALWRGAPQLDGGAGGQEGPGAPPGGARPPLHPRPLQPAASPRPSVLAHQVPNARKLRRKEQLWEKLAKQGELPREVRKAQARLRNPPAVRAKPGPQDTVERPFYDLWAKDSEYPGCHLWVGTGLPCTAVWVVHCTVSKGSAP